MPYSKISLTDPRDSQYELLSLKPLSFIISGPNTGLLSKLESLTIETEEPVSIKKHKGLLL